MAIEAKVSRKPFDKCALLPFSRLQAMDKSTLLQTVLTSMLTAVLTLLCGQWQMSSQNDRTDRLHFIDGAQTTAQETSQLLNDEYNELVKLVDATGDKGWSEFAAAPYHDYVDFHRRWRQKLIEEHFKLSRYFGKDVADQLIHLDEIDLHPVDNLGSPNPCTPVGGNGDFDISKLADQTECVARLITAGEDMIKETRKAEWPNKEFFESLKSKRDQEDFAMKLLEQYDRSSVSVLRVLENRLSQLGEPKVTLVHDPKM